jgi:hypothetical protein
MMMTTTTMATNQTTVVARLNPLLDSNSLAESSSSLSTTSLLSFSQCLSGLMTISGGKHKPNEEKTNPNLRIFFFKASVLVGQRNLTYLLC